MQILRKILLKIHHFFEAYYATICLGSIFTGVMYAFLHYEFRTNKKDLIYWKELMEFCYHQLDEFDLMVIMCIIIVKVTILGAFIWWNSNSVRQYNELTQLEVKKRYADFLLLRLIADIDNIETKYLRGNNTGDIITLKSFILAHEHMRITINNFRRDAIKLLTPSEEDINSPAEEVYSVLETEMRYITRSRFHNMGISADDNVIKNLVNP